MNFYFDDDRELVRWKSKWKKKKWLARREMWRQHDSSRLFGAASVVASNLWAGMPAGLRRLADGCGYGRLVGRCVSLIEGDGQLWDADLLKGLELNEHALAPSVHFRLRENGAGTGIRLEGLAQLNRELDLALGDGAGTMPASFLVAHGLNKFGLGMNGLKLTAEEAQVKTAFRVGGARDQGQGAGKSLRLSSGPECEKARGASRRFRVWVNAVKVAETRWNQTRKKFYLDTCHGVGGVGYVTDWEQNFPDSLDLRNPFEGEKMEFDGDYVVYCALEVSEKRGRHWVRLPYCCKFRVVDTVLIEGGELVNERIEGLESTGGAVESGKREISPFAAPSLRSGHVWASCSALDMVESEGVYLKELGSALVDSSDHNRLLLIEFKRPFGAWLDMGWVQNLEALWLQNIERVQAIGKGIRAGP